MCLEAAGVEPAEAVMVGDTEHDALGAAAAGMDFIAVTYGFGFRKKEDAMRFERTLGAAERPREILDYIG